MFSFTIFTQPAKPSQFLSVAAVEQYVVTMCLKNIELQTENESLSVGNL